MNLHFDLQSDLITVSEAATLAGVSDAVIRQWKRRGHLEQAGEEDLGRPLFTGIAVLRAEAKTRPRARRDPVRHDAGSREA
jgi:hypothetical protein